MNHNPQLLYELARAQREQLIANAEAYRLSQLVVTNSNQEGRRFWLRWPRFGRRTGQPVTTLAPSLN